MSGVLSAPRLNARASLLAFAVSILGVGEASAQAVRQQRTDSYYALHAGLSAVFLSGSLVARYVSTAPTVDDGDWFGDRSIRGRYSARSAAFSDGTLALSVVLPPALTASQTDIDRYANASVIYAEVLSLNLFANALVKYSVRRPRPMNYVLGGKAQLGRCDREQDLCLSFYSGHASTAFAAAVSGSLLFADTGNASLAWRAGVWGLEMMLASTTTGLRVRAGKHYYSDVIVGALIGTVLGIGLPVLHGLKRSPEPGETLAGVTGLVLGGALASLGPTAWRYDTAPESALKALQVRPLIHPSSGALGVAVTLGPF